MLFPLEGNAEEFISYLNGEISTDTDIYKSVEDVKIDGISIDKIEVFCNEDGIIGTVCFEPEEQADELYDILHSMTVEAYGESKTLDKNQYIRCDEWGSNIYLCKQLTDSKIILRYKGLADYSASDSSLLADLYNLNMAEFDGMDSIVEMLKQLTR